MATMLAWGLNVTAVKLLTGWLDIWLVAALRMLVATTVLVILFRYRGLTWPRWSGRTLLLGCLSGVLMVYGNQALFGAGVQRTSATNAALVLALGPFISGLLEALIFRKRMGRIYMLGVACAMAGVALVILNRPHAQLSAGAMGDWLMLGAVLSFAGGGVVMQRLTRHLEPLAVTVFVHLVGAALLTVHMLWTVDAPVEAVMAQGWLTWVLVGFSGVVATALGAVAWGRAIALIGVGKTAAHLSWVPVFGVGFGALLLGEPLSAWHFLGVLAVLGGTFMATRRTR